MLIGEHGIFNNAHHLFVCVDTVVCVYNFPLNDEAQGTKIFVGGSYDAFFFNAT